MLDKYRAGKVAARPGPSRLLNFLGLGRNCFGAQFSMSSPARKYIFHVKLSGRAGISLALGLFAIFGQAGSAQNSIDDAQPGPKLGRAAGPILPPLDKCNVL